MNNFVFSQDPLLYQNLSSPLSRPGQGEYDMKQQLDNAIAQYQSMQQSFNSKQSPQGKDHLGELDELMKELDDSVAEKLKTNQEFITLNAQVQEMIQAEIMRSVKWKINSNPDAIAKIDSLKGMIKTATKEQTAEEKRNMLELNDYLNNYSSMSFDDYKRIKTQTKNVNDESNRS